MAKLTPGKLIFIFFLLFFIFIPNYDQGYDSYAFLLDARDGIEIVHPHHLLYNVFRYLLFHFSASLGVEPMKFISFASSILGALSLAFIFNMLRRRSSPEIALTGTMIIGVIYSFWYYSTTVEVNIVSILFLVLSLFYLTKDNESRGSVISFMLLTIGILFHQILVLALIPMLLYDIRKSGSLVVTLKRSMVSLIPGFIIYIAVAFIAATDPGISGAYAWLMKYPELGRWGIIHSGSVITSMGGVAKSVFGGSILRQALFGNKRSYLEILYLIGAGLSISGLILIFASSLRDNLRSKNPELILLLGTALIFVIFAFWWAPHDGGFWFYPVLLILIIIFSSLKATKFTSMVVYITLLVFALINITGEFVPASRNVNSVALNGASSLAKLHLTENDIVLTNMPQIILAYSYHYNVNVPYKSVAYLEPGPKKTIVDQYRSMISNFPGKVIIFENEIYPESHRRFLFGRFSRKEYTEVYEPLMPSLVSVDSVRYYGEWITLYEFKHATENE